MISAAFSISYLSLIVMPDRLSASGILGVITVASGISFLISTSSASLVMSFLPLVDTITGSNTILTALYFLNSSATCIANSRVGHKIIACKLLSSLSIFSSNGIPNAAVLPVPV